jgi:hypothetical protein
MELYTYIHVLVSLVAIASGFIVLFGMLTGRRLDRWNVFFLATTAATSLTGFGFPIHGFTPGLAIGVVSLAVLAVAAYARYGRALGDGWGRVYVIGATLALYLNFLVLIVQSFQKVPALKALAPTQSEAPFLVAQVVALAAFICLGTLAAIKFRVGPAHTG